MTRGRVIARDGTALRVRTVAGDVVVAGVARPGDLVAIEGDRVEVLRAYGGGDYPGPGTEVARLPPDRVAALRARARVVAAIRRFFDDRGFLEVDTPVRVPSPGLELHLTAVPSGPRRWLITSPEYQMKRLLVGGLERIYTVCKCFRADEQGAQHAGEFTMLEWYRAWDRLAAIRGDTEALVAACAEAVRGAPRVIAGGREVDVTPPWQSIPVAEAMARWAGVEVRGDEEAGALRERVVAAGIDPGDATAWDDVFYAAFVARVEPALAALERPVFVTDWPAPLSALARPSPADPRVVERFEAYVAGIELANAFGELTDPAEQRRRFEADVAERQRRGRDAYPIDDRLLAALDEGMPDSGGIALGVDRLAMLCAGVDDIRQVLSFAEDEL